MNKLFKMLFLSTIMPAGCGAAGVECPVPVAGGVPRTRPWFPHTAYYTNSIYGGLSDTTEETIDDLEERANEQFLHAAPVADMDIKIVFGDLEENVIWRAHCVITMSNKLNPLNKKEYRFWSSEDFAGVLRHELGHCFGMDHSDDPKSIMYWQYNPEIHLTEEAISRFSEDLKRFRDSH